MKIFVKRLYQKSYSFEKFFVIGIFLIVSSFYFSDTLNYWFFYDDPGAMVSSTESLKKIFFGRIYSYAFYTPFVALSFKPDVALFGMNPLPYHIHNMIVLVFIAFMVYLMLRLYTDRVSSLVSSVIVLFSAPSLVCIIWITLRQYLYAMFFSLIATYLYLKYKPALRHNRFIVLIILILCEFSFMSKEQFMTLPFVLFIISEGNLKQRACKTYPYFLLLILHFLLRLYVLGGIGGYLGFQYDFKVYMRTIFESIFITSKVIFGHVWVVILIALPLFFKPKKIILSMQLWLISLSISFLAMFFYPSADTYRYWFIPMILFSFSVGFSASIIRNRLLKASFLLTIMTLFLSNSLNINRDLKELFNNETLLAKQVAESMIDRKYRNSMVLCPNDSYIVESSYIYCLSMAYRRISGIEHFATFYPMELIAFYPDVTRDFENVYEIKGKGIVNITTSMEKKINLFKTAISSEKPEIKLFKNDNGIRTMLKCRSGKLIIRYSIKRIADKYYASKNTLPYLENINLIPYTKNEAVLLLPIENLSYHEKKWHIGRRPVANNEAVITCSCMDEQGQNTLLSDILFIPNKNK